MSEVPDYLTTNCALNHCNWPLEPVGDNPIAYGEGTLRMMRCSRCGLLYARPEPE